MILTFFADPLIEEVVIIRSPRQQLHQFFDILLEVYAATSVMALPVVVSCDKDCDRRSDLRYEHLLCLTEAGYFLWDRSEVAVVQNLIQRLLLMNQRLLSFHSSNAPVAARLIMIFL